MSLSGAVGVLTPSERARHPEPLVLQAYFDGWNQAIGRSPTTFPRFLGTREEREWRLGWADGKKAGPPPEPEREPVPLPVAKVVPPRPAAVPYPPVDGSQPCAQTDPEAWFPEKGGSNRDAKRICEGCEFREPCRDYAIAATFAGYPVTGVWGGTSEKERREMRRGVAAA